MQIRQQEQVVHTQEGVQLPLYSDMQLEQVVTEGLHLEENSVQSPSRSR